VGHSNWNCSGHRELDTSILTELFWPKSLISAEQRFTKDRWGERKATKRKDPSIILAAAACHPVLHGVAAAM